MVRMPTEGDHARTQPLGSSGYAKDQWKPIDYLARSVMTKQETKTHWEFISWEFIIERYDKRNITAAVKWRDEHHRGGRGDPWLIEIVEDMGGDYLEIPFYCSFTIDEPFESDRAFTVAEGIVKNVSHWPTGSFGHHGHIRPPKPEPEPVPEPPGTAKEAQSETLDPEQPIFLLGQFTGIWHEVLSSSKPGWSWECIHCYNKFSGFEVRKGKPTEGGLHCTEQVEGEEE